MSMHGNIDCVCRDASALDEDIMAVWPDGEFFVKASDLIERLVNYAPSRWSDLSCYGKELTAQRMGRYLSQHRAIFAVKIGARRGYCRHSFEKP